MNKYNEEYRPPRTLDDKLDALIILVKENTHRFNRLIRKVEKMSATTDHLNAAVATLVREVGEAAAKFAELAQAVRDAAPDNAAVEAAAVAIEAQAAALDAAANATTPPAPTE